MPVQAWPPLNLTNLRNALDDLAALVEHPPTGMPDEVIRYLSRFLVVRTCGYLERVVQITMTEYTTSKATPQIASFANVRLNRSVNPTPGKLLDLIAGFDSGWRQELEDLLQDGDGFLHREIAFLVSRRHLIAHGEPEGITARRALDLKVAVELVSQWFIDRFNPD